MKMVKSLLLGTAAGLVAMTGAQAADLPVKAKPVQYVKICSLYGAGFYYIPGTDMCLKIGGYVRAEYAWNNNASVTTQQSLVNNRGSNNDWWRQRGYITADARNQTEYGTVRGYIAVGLSTNDTGNATYNSGNQFDANRAMIQFAGFTFGRTQSFYDFYSSAAQGYIGYTPNSDTGDGGQNVLAYTAQFGNGLSGSLALETRRMTQLVNVASATNTSGSTSGVFGAANFSATGVTNAVNGAYAGNNVPDIVGNLRVDQAWGSAQIMGVLHEVNATYYADGNGPAATTTGIENNGRPGDKWGFVVGAGLKVNAPMIGQGDYLDTQVNYTQGALRYIFQNPGSGNWYIQHGQNGALGVLSDGVYGGTGFAGSTTGSSIELTTAWNVNAHYEHFWNKSWQTSAYGGYAAVSYNSNANGGLCFAQGMGAIVGSTATANAGCNNNWSSWWAGTRTQFNLDSQTFVGLDILYLSMSGMSPQSSNLGTLPGSVAPSSSATRGVVANTQNNWAGRLRVHRNFYP